MLKVCDCILSEFGCCRLLHAIFIVDLGLATEGDDLGLLPLLVLSASDPFKLCLKHEQVLPEGLSEYRSLNLGESVAVARRYLSEGCLDVGVAGLGDLVGTSEGF